MRLRHLLLAMLLLPSILLGEGMAYPNQYRGMAEGLFDMVDALSSAYQNHMDKNSSRFTMPPLQRRPSNTPNPFPATQPSTQLDGSWQGRNGEVLVIRQGQFRLYPNRTTHKQGLLTIRGPRLLLMHDPETNSQRFYEYAEQQGKLALRDQNGNMLLFKRIN
ncbi:MAG: hypothetical protein GY696_31560 [Gammaproteobacteria bacterium]|nr:hypothetical protein [Gammaproteobacteria bacterium]